MNDLNFNNLNDRIDTLYHSINTFVSRLPVAEISLTETTSVSPEGKEVIRISFGGGTISKEEIVAAKHCFTDMISRLANLKDPLKKNIKSLGNSPNIVEKAINCSEELCLIMDLNNQEKHGYPLTRARRSELDPLIQNIRKESNIPLVPGRFTNFFSESVVTYEADVCKENGEIIIDFRTMIKKAIRDWEDFLLKNMPDKCESISIKRSLENKKRIWNEHMEAQRKKVEELENNENVWVEIPGHFVQEIMYLKAKGIKNNSVEYRGFPIKKTIDFEDGDVVPIFEVTFGEIMSLSKNNNQWWMLTCETNSDLKLVNDYYWELYNPPIFD